MLTTPPLWRARYWPAQRSLDMICGWSYCTMRLGEPVDRLVREKTVTPEVEATNSSSRAGLMVKAEHEGETD
jgi:hypothetical protein